MGVTRVELLNKAKLMMELRGYTKEEARQAEGRVDITASKPDSDETVVMRIVTKSKLKSDSVGVNTARAS